MDNKYSRNDYSSPSSRNENRKTSRLDERDAYGRNSHLKTSDTRSFGSSNDYNDARLEDETSFGSYGSSFDYGYEQDRLDRMNSDRTQYSSPRRSSSLRQSWSPSQSYGQSARDWNSSDRFNRYQRSEYDRPYRKEYDHEDKSFGDRVEEAWESTKDSVKSFFGKGPKGYKRSDDRICEDVCEALYNDRHVDASEIEVKVKDGEVTLSGTAPSRFMKRHAEDCAENVSGVKDVRNEIRVQSTTDRSSTLTTDYSEKSSDKAKSKQTSIM